MTFRDRLRRRRIMREIRSMGLHPRAVTDQIEVFHGVTWIGSWRWDNPSLVYALVAVAPQPQPRHLWAVRNGRGSA